jgi:hypothetical protein
LLDPTVSGAAFSSMRFRVTVEQTLVDDVTFNDVTTAISYFDDRVIDLGPITAGVSGSLDVSFQLDVTSSVAGGFSTLFIVGNATPGAGLPEPAGTPLLLAASVPLLRRRRVQRG